ncbi:MAG: hypothetical protein HC930_10545 [Hydrococcus sp. SU_1_0]|nr:hypothetical protein [Hydrococcus sp. SU_1_0]
MISTLAKTLLRNPSISKTIEGNEFLTCVFLNLARPELLLARITEQFSPWFKATEYKGKEIQVQRVYSFMYGRGAWAVRVRTKRHGWEI